MEEKNLKIIKQTVEDLISKIGFQSEVKIIKEGEEGENIVCNIVVGDDPHILIGQYGVNLQALQHLARLLVRKKTDEKVKFALDVNSYRQEKNQSVIEQARLAAEEAVNDGRAIVMRPMSAYERRIVHMALADNEKVVTESIGEGESRKVVVKPAKQI